MKPCKSYEKIILDGDSDLAFFLVDNDINSKGIFLAAALKGLGNLQNKLKSMMAEEGKKGERLQLISSLTEDGIFSMDDLFLQSLAETCSINRAELGRGKEILFDFDRVQLNLEAKLIEVKTINTEVLDTIQYQYELLNTKSEFSGIIGQVRLMISQVTLSDQEFLNIERNAKQAANSFKVNDLIIFNEIYSLLNRLLSILLKQDLKNLKTIGDINIFKLKLHSKYNSENLIKEISVHKITSLFETIEVKIYSLVLKSISDDYKLQLSPDSNSRESVNGFKILICEKYGYRVFIEANNVLKRMACRLLTANFDPNFFIYEYFGNANYWSLSFTETVDEISELFPKEFTFKNAVKLIETFDDIISQGNAHTNEVLRTARNSNNPKAMRKSIIF